MDGKRVLIGDITFITNTRSIKHTFGRSIVFSPWFGVRKIYNFFNSWLDDHFGTFIARKESYIHGSVFGTSICIEDCIDLCMDDITMFVLKWICRMFVSRKFIITTSFWETIISCTYDDFIIIDKTCSYLRIRVFTSLCGE